MTSPYRVGQTVTGGRETKTEKFTLQKVQRKEKTGKKNRRVGRKGEGKLRRMRSR